MTTEELQTEFPIGSRWRVAKFSVGTTYTVIAHHQGSGVILIDDLGIPINRQPLILRGQWERVPESVRNAIDRAAELKHLRRWRAEAEIVLAEWEDVWLAAGQPGPIGRSKAANVRRFINDLVSPP